MEAKMCPRICIASLRGRPTVTAWEVLVDGGRPMIRLSLRKPRGWGWKLTASASSPAVVCLVDDNGNVLHAPVDRNINLATALDRARHWNERPESEAVAGRGHRRKNERTNQGSSTESEAGRGHRRKNERTNQGSSTESEAGRGHRRKNERTNQSSSTESEAEMEVCNRVRRHRRKKDSGYKSLRVGGHSPVRRDRDPDTCPSSFKRGKDPHTCPSSFRRGKDPDIGYSSLTRSKESPVVTDGESIPRGRRRHGRAYTLGHGAAPAPPPRRPRRRRPPLRAMGSNVSRQGLSGRRTQSSGNLCNGNKILAARDVLTAGGSAHDKDRNRLCGSLPNYLDDRCCHHNNNNNCEASSSMKARLEEHKQGLELRLLPQQDLALQDQGYASERSPEDEHPLYPFITPGALFQVSLCKGNRGLGLSVTGGIETAEQWPGLIRIKRVFPHQPAWQSGQLAPGDILLAANGVPLTGLTNYQALEVLRTSPSGVVLELCRPPSDVFCAVAPPTEPPLPPRRDASYRLSSSQIVTPLPLLQIEEPSGEFDIVLQKVNRSLGFTLRKEDESVLGHYVRALVREPALSDGRIRPGDKIVEVNDVPLSPMSHEEAVTFLRQCGETVKLRLYRDAAQTPVAALSPSDTDPDCVRPRPVLRQEARDMLTDLAVRKLSPTNSSSSAHGGLLQCLSGGSTPGASPRRRRLTKTPSPDIALVAREKVSQRYSVCESSLPQRPDFLDLQPESDSPQASRKQKYTFSGPGSQDAGPPLEPSSLPPLSSTSSTSTAFSYRNPAYHSANPIKSADEDISTECVSEQDLSGEGGRTCGLVKWKGVVFSPQAGGQGEVEDEGRVLTVELNRGWNSRLGFSLQADGHRTYVSAIYADSVAAKDGRLKARDRLLTVNDEDVEAMTTGEIIDLLRKIRGTIEIRVLRRSGPNLEPS